MTLQSNVQIGDYHGPKSANFIRSILEHIRQLVHGSMSESRSRLRQLTWETARTVAIAAGVTFGPLSVILFGFWFQPGWASGWPLPKHTVWAFGMTAIVAAQFILLSAAVSILLSYFAEQKIKKAFLGWSLFLSTMFLVVAATLIAFPILHHFLMTAIEEVWL